MTRKPEAGHGLPQASRLPNLKWNPWDRQTSAATNLKGIIMMIIESLCLKGSESG